MIFFSRIYLFNFVVALAAVVYAQPPCPSTLPQRDPTTGRKIGAVSSANNTGAANSKNTTIGNTSTTKH